MTPEQKAKFPHGMPDLTPTIIDSETGEVIHQGLEGPEIEELRAEHREASIALLKKNRAEMEARASLETPSLEAP